MECLKFELFSPSATFKTPFSLKGIETYPLPTYSAIIGLLYTALGRKWSGEEFSISVQGRYETIFRDYIRLRKYNKKDKKLEVLPIEIPRLYRLSCTVHIVGESELLEEMKCALERPKTYLFLSGGEYPVFVKEPRLLKAEEKFFEGETKLSAYVPQNKVNLFFQKGIPFRIPSFFEKTEGERSYKWESVYYYPESSYLEGEVLIDEEGDLVWV